MELANSASVGSEAATGLDMAIKLTHKVTQMKAHKTLTTLPDKVWYSIAISG